MAIRLDPKTQHAGCGELAQKLPADERGAKRPIQGGRLERGFRRLAVFARVRGLTSGRPERAASV
ncbi:MAG TPA: hypothetical protein VNE18_09985 [Rhodanobacter sp.]|nr:hypothetical protein [Rhodanobacter sp.]